MQKIIGKAIGCFLLVAGCSSVIAQKKSSAIYSGVPWFDNKGNPVSARMPRFMSHETGWCFMGLKPRRSN